MGGRMKVDETLISEMSTVMKLAFSKEEIDDLVLEVNETLGMLTTLSEVDTENIEGTHYGTVGNASFRKDEPVQNPEEVAALLEQARASKDSLIEVPAILDNGEGGA